MPTVIAISSKLKMFHQKTKAENLLLLDIKILMRCFHLILFFIDLI